VIIQTWIQPVAAVAMMFGLPAAAVAQSGGSGAEPEQQNDRDDDSGGSEATAPNSFEGFDFGQVVETMESSVSPLQTEMNESFKLFTGRIQEAERMLDEGRTNEAVQTASAAIDGVLEVRDRVLEPMWEGQRSLTEQTSQVRRRLARAVALEGRQPENGRTQLDSETEATLDNIAGRIAEETDPTRKKRLTAHYRTVRNLARIKMMAQQLSPDQRQLWMNVLQVLDEAALAHQQVLMGSEVLFAQLEATSVNLQEYLSLMETVQGASELLSVVRGARRHGEGMSGFVASMSNLQGRLGAFNESVQQALEGRMIELSAQIDAIEPLEGDVAGPGGGGAVMTAQSDAELNERIRRLTAGAQ